jgi:hypothetical protein
MCDDIAATLRDLKKKEVYLYTTQGKERLTNGVVRPEPVRDLLRQHLSDEVMKRCQ